MLFNENKGSFWCYHSLYVYLHLFVNVRTTSRIAKFPNNPLDAGVQY